MTYGSDSKGKGYIEIDPDEKKKLEEGQSLTKVLGCKDGLFKLTVSIKKISDKVI